LGDAPLSVGDDQIDVVAGGAVEREVLLTRRFGRGVEIGLVEHQVLISPQRRAVGDLELQQIAGRVAQKPAADVDRLAG